VLIALMVVSAFLALVGVFVLTDAGQLLRIGKRTVVAYFRVHMWIMALSIALFVAAVLLSARQDVLRSYRPNGRGPWKRLPPLSSV
jgi:hypothetical protein